MAGEKVGKWVTCAENKSIESNIVFKGESKKRYGLLKQFLWSLPTHSRLIECFPSVWISLGWQIGFFYEELDSQSFPVRFYSPFLPYFLLN
jgi:hypothetical protein